MHTSRLELSSALKANLVALLPLGGAGKPTSREIFSVTVLYRSVPRPWCVEAERCTEVTSNVRCRGGSDGNVRCRGGSDGNVRCRGGSDV